MACEPSHLTPSGHFCQGVPQILFDATTSSLNSGLWMSTISSVVILFGILGVNKPLG